MTEAEKAFKDIDKMVIVRKYLECRKQVEKQCATIKRMRYRLSEAQK